jgi:hypothetical protein
LDQRRRPARRRLLLPPLRSCSLPPRIFLSSSSSEIDLWFQALLLPLLILSIADGMVVGGGVRGSRPTGPQIGGPSSENFVHPHMSAPPLQMLISPRCHCSVVPRRRLPWRGTVNVSVATRHGLRLAAATTTSDGGLAVVWSMLSVS